MIHVSTINITLVLLSYYIIIQPEIALVKDVFLSLVSVIFFITKNVYFNGDIFISFPATILQV